MYWIGRWPCGITFLQMFIRSSGVGPRPVAGLILVAGLLTAVGALGQETPRPAPETPPALQQESPPPQRQEAPSPPPPLDEQPSALAPVLVTAPPPVSSSSEVFIPGKDFELLPQGRPGDLLRLIPGFVISQHQGGGKAEQYLLRGFDADHGTDVALFVDGLPVNLRSHAHGQGYADLHFLIPETVARLDAFKGPYFVEYGDFATAGAVNFVLRDFVEENYAEASGGSFGTMRYITLLSPTKDALKTLIAAEYYRSDGPFEHPNGYNRFNILGKAKATVAEGMDLSVWASYYWASWHGSGEIPVRAVRAGTHLALRRHRCERGRPDPAAQPQRGLDVAPRRGADDRGARVRQLLHARPVQQLHLLSERSRERRRDQSARPPPPRGDRRPVPVPEQAVRDEPHQHRRVPVPHRYPARGAGDVHPAPPDGTHPGREHRRAVLLAVRQVRPRAGPVGPLRHGRARRHLHLQRVDAGEHDRRRYERLRHQGAPEREGQPRARSLVGHRALRQRRHRLSQQRRAGGGRRSHADGAADGARIRVRPSDQDHPAGRALGDVLVPQPRQRARVRR